MRLALGLVCGVAGIAAAAIAAWRFGGTWAVIPFAALAPLSAALAWIDLTSHRLPNRIVLPGIGASVLGLLAASAGDQALDRFVAVLIGGAALFGLYLALALVSRGGMGMGDVKLAAIVGLFGGYLGLTGWMLAAASAFVTGGVAALVLLLARRDTRARLPFGPWMLVGLWIAVVLSATR